MNVVLTHEALSELIGIWNWNAEDRGSGYADAYLRFLEKRLAGLSRTCSKGRTVEGLPDLRYLLMRRKSSGHGHVAVYTVDADAVTVVHIFHTAQDWQDKFSDEPEAT